MCKPLRKFFLSARAKFLGSSDGKVGSISLKASATNTEASCSKWFKNIKNTSRRIAVFGI